MGTNVFANNNEIVSKGADGKSVAAFPDVCWTPPAPPVGPIPLPYPNSTEDKDLDNGTTTVQIKDKTVCMGDTSYIAKSKGDEGATQSQQKNLLTSAIQGKGYFITSSQDVKVEGKGATRHLDMMTHNHACPAGTGPQGEVSGVGSGGREKKIENDSTQSEPLEIISVALARRNVIDADGKLKTLNIVSTDKVQKSNEFYQSNKEKTEDIKRIADDINLITDKKATAESKLDLNINEYNSCEKRLQAYRKANDTDNITKAESNLVTYQTKIDINRNDINTSIDDLSKKNSEKQNLLEEKIEYAFAKHACIQFVTFDDHKTHSQYEIFRSDGYSDKPDGILLKKNDKPIGYVVNIPSSVSGNTPIISDSMMGTSLEFQVLLNRGLIENHESIAVVLETKACNESGGVFTYSSDYKTVIELPCEALIRDVVLYTFKCTIDVGCFSKYRLKVYLCDKQKGKIADSAVESVEIETWKKVIYTKFVENTANTSVDAALQLAHRTFQDLKIDLQELFEVKLGSEIKGANLIGANRSSCLKETIRTKHAQSHVAASQSSLPLDALVDFVCGNSNHADGDKYVKHLLFFDHGCKVHKNVQNENIRWEYRKKTRMYNFILGLVYNRDKRLVNHNITDGGFFLDIVNQSSSVLKGINVKNSDYNNSGRQVFNIRITHNIDSGASLEKYSITISIPETNVDSTLLTQNLFIKFKVYDVQLGFNDYSTVQIGTLNSTCLNDFSNNPTRPRLNKDELIATTVHELGHLLRIVYRKLGMADKSHCFFGLGAIPVGEPTDDDKRKANCVMFSTNFLDKKEVSDFCTECKKELIRYDAQY